MTPETDGGLTVLPFSAVGGLLAAGLVAGLRFRRRRQLQSRPLGRRLLEFGPSAQPVQAAAVRLAKPVGLRTLDRATRAVAAHCQTEARPLPALQWATVSDEGVDLHWAEPVPHPPVGFTAVGSAWHLDPTDAPYLGSVPGLGEAPRPWPSLVTLGCDEKGRTVVVDLEALGVLRISGEDMAAGHAVLAAVGLELACAPWADELTLTVVGVPDAGMLSALDHPNVTTVDGLDTLLDRLERRASHSPSQPAALPPAQRRLEAELADPWAPEVVLVAGPLTTEQGQRLLALANGDSPLAVAAVVCDPHLAAPASLTLGSLSGRDGVGSETTDTTPALPSAVLSPGHLRVVPQRLSVPERAAVAELLHTTGDDQTTPAPWWAEEHAAPERPPDPELVLGRRFAGWGDEDGEEVAMRSEPRPGWPGLISGPVLQLMGPVELAGAAGPAPARAARQCLEYCAWLLEHPGTTSPAMANALIVAEGTRRSNMSRLRSWLGESPDGEPYLPDAYTGRIRLHPSVSSDWQQVQILTFGGVNRASTDALRAALGLVRGAPLADAAPGQWCWAEELRTDMISCLRDLGVELARRGLADGDIDLARWSASRALVAAPGDELLLLARIRTEHRAGNGAEAERLTLQLAAQARSLGVDLADETVEALQEVMEGRVRARTT